MKIPSTILKKKERQGNWWFYFIILYIIIDYGRPQDLIPIGFLRPAMFITLILVLYLILNRKFFDFSSKQIKMIWLFILVSAFRVPFAVNRHWAFGTTLTMFLYMPFILSLINCVDSYQRLRRIILWMLILMAWVSLYSIGHGGLGMGNYFADENDVSLYINIFLPFCYFLFLIEKSIRMKFFYFGCLLIGLIAVVASFSRGGFVGLLCLSLVIWLNSPKKILFLLLILVLSSIVYLWGGHAYVREMKTIEDRNDRTAQERLWSWEAAWKMFLDNPLGVGGNNFQVRFPEYQSSKFKRGMYGRVAHSLWFTLIPELGIPGILVYFVLLYYNLMSIFALRRMGEQRVRHANYFYALSLSFLSSFAGFFSSASFLSVLYYPHYWYLTGLIVATERVAKSIQRDMA